MRNEDKERLNQQTQKKYLFQRLIKGCKAVWENTVHKIILIAFYPAAILIWYLFKSGLGLEDIPLVSPVLFVLVDLMLPALLIGGTLVILILFGTPYGFNQTSNEFQRIGMTNSAGEVPMLLTRTQDKRHSNVEILEFDAVGIPLTEWHALRTYTLRPISRSVNSIVPNKSPVPKPGTHF